MGMMVIFQLHVVNSDLNNIADVNILLKHDNELIVQLVNGNAHMSR